MAFDGSLKFDTKIDTSGFDKGASNIQNSAGSIGKSMLGVAVAIKAVELAFNLVRDSIDAAFKRIDTMERFQRTMTVLSGSSEEAAVALEDIRQKVTGTAYGLDVAAKSVQGFVTSGMGLSTATRQIGTLADAVSFYGEGTNENLESVTHAWQQMAASGKVYTQDVNMLINAGIPAWELYSQATGKSVAEIQKATKDGAITAEQFQGALITAMETGAGIFPSVTGAAKEAGASWAGTFDNMKAATARGVVGIISSIDEMLGANGLPSLRDMVKNVGVEFENTMKFISNNLETIIPMVTTLISGFIAFKAAATIGSIVKGFQEAQLAIGLFSIGQSKAAIQQGVLNGVFSAWEIIVGLFTGKITLATAAQAAWNGVMALAGGPIGLIIIGITALIAAFVYLWNTNEGFRDFFINAWQGIVNFFTTTIPAAFKSVLDFVQNNWQGILLFIVNPFAGAFKLLYDNFEGFRNFVDGFIESVKNFFINGWNSIVSFLTETIPNLMVSIGQWFAELPANIGYALGYALGTIVRWGIDLYNWAIVEIPRFIDNVITFFVELPGRIWDAIVSAKDRLVEWATALWGVVSTEVPKIIDNVITFFQELPMKVWNSIISTKDKVVEWVSNLITTAKTEVPKFSTSVMDAIKELPGKFLEIGKNIVEGIWNGISGAGKWLWGKITDFANGIVKGFKDALGIHSPSTIFRDLIGKNMARGIAVGFEVESDDMKQSMISNMADLTAGIQQEVMVTGQISGQAGTDTSTTSQSTTDIQVNNTFNQPVASPWETVRAIRLMQEELAYA